MAKRAVIGLSGGVDSSVAAHLLKQEGYEVTALFMINWHDKTGIIDADCPWDEDVVFAELVAKKLEIPFHVTDLSVQYRQRVIDYMFSEYQKGRTPNPDVLCNREIKFDAFLEAASRFDADYVATGHYCRKQTLTTPEGRVIHRLLAGEDPGKEQSYFLCQLSQEQLARTLFPIGDLHKSRVRRIARELGLASAEKKDSQGICFVGKVHLPVFLQQRLEKKEGNIFEIPAGHPAYGKQIPRTDLEEFCRPITYSREDGIWVGKHQGAHFFTVGQRKGLQVGGKSEPLFVLATDVEKNRVYVGQGQAHPGLYRQGLKVRNEEVHWIREDLAMEPGEQREYMVRIRYRQPLQKANLHMTGEGTYILFTHPQRGIAAGQFAAWYEGDELIGSAPIAE